MNICYTRYEKMEIVMMNNCICLRPFSEIEIHTDGNVYTCCPDWLKNYPIGNIFEAESFDEIWYSQKAIELRRYILNGSYDFCKVNICNKKFNEDIELVEKPPYPTLVRFAYDTQCNLKCMICRDSLIYNSQHKIEEYNELTDKLFIPILKNAKLMSITSAGEITSSEHSQCLVKKAAELYPNLKFEILTNGLLFDADFCNKLGITDRIERINISLHAMEKETYEKIMRGSKYDKVMSNLDWIFSLKKSGKINDVCLIFVAFSLNYKEIPSFIDYARRNGVHASVWEYRNHYKTIMDSKYSEYAVWEQSHPKYNDFVKVIEKVKENYGTYCNMPELFYNLKSISILQSVKHKIKRLFK